MALPSSTHAQFTATPEELQLLADCLTYTNSTASRIVSTEDSMDIFNCSGLHESDKREIWSIADKDRNGMLTSRELAVALRLIGWVQAGEPLTEQLVELPGPLPTLEGISNVPTKEATSSEVRSGPTLPASNSRRTSFSTPGSHAPPLSHSRSQSTSACLSPIETDQSPIAPIVFLPETTIRHLTFLTSPRSTRRRAPRSPSRDSPVPTDGTSSAMSISSSVSLLPISSVSYTSVASMPLSMNDSEVQYMSPPSTGDSSETPEEPLGSAQTFDAPSDHSRVLDSPVLQEDIDPFVVPPSPSPPTPITLPTPPTSNSGLNIQLSQSPVSSRNTPPLPASALNPQTDTTSTPELAKLISLLAASTARADALEQSLRESETAMQDLIREHAIQVEALQSDLEVATVRIYTLEPLEAELLTLRAELEGHPKQETENEKLRQELSKSEKEIYNLEMRLSEAQDEIIASTATISKFSSEFDRLTRLLQEKERTSAVSDKRVAELQSVVEGLQIEDDGDPLSRTLAELNKSRAEETFLRAAMRELQGRVDALVEDGEKKDMELMVLRRDAQTSSQDVPLEPQRSKPSDNAGVASTRGIGLESTWTLISTSSPTGTGAGGNASLTRRGTFGGDSGSGMAIVGGADPPPPTYDDAVFV